MFVNFPEVKWTLHPKTSLMTIPHESVGRIVAFECFDDPGEDSEIALVNVVVKPNTGVFSLKLQTHDSQPLFGYPMDVGIGLEQKLQEWSSKCYDIGRLGEISFESASGTENAFTWALDLGGNATWEEIKFKWNIDLIRY